MDSNIAAAAVTVLTSITTTSSMMDVLLTREHEEDEGHRYRYRPPIPYTSVPDTHLLDIDTVLGYHLMRFTPDETRAFLPLLRLDRLRFRARVRATPEQAIGVVLVRLSYPTRYWQMMETFGHSRTWISIVFNDTIIYLYRRYRRILEWDEDRLTFEQLSKYARAIFDKGGSKCIWGWIDGTLNATCRPMMDQQQYYSGHKRKHGYKYQAIVTPDGLVSSLMGPFIGRRGDWRMVQMSQLQERLRAVNAGRPPSLALYLYGDPAYTTVYGIMGPFKNHQDRPRTSAQYAYNLRMSRLRIEVEHGFALHQNLWTMNGFHISLKVGQGAAVCYAVSVLLANIWTCLRGNQTSQRFRIAPPNVEDYLRLNQVEQEVDALEESVRILE